MHIALLNHGMFPPLALLLVGCVALLIIALLIIILLWQCARLRNLPKISCEQSPVTATVDAFISGLMGR